MSDTKKIIINTDDFKLTGGAKRTRKRSTEGAMPPELRVRQPVRPRNATPRNNNTLLKFIRKHQEEKRRQLMEDSPLDESTFFGDGGGGGAATQESFDQTLAYFTNMAEHASVVQQPQQIASTFPYQYPSPSPYLAPPTPQYGGVITNENVSMNFPAASPYQDFFGTPSPANPVGNPMGNPIGDSIQVAQPTVAGGEAADEVLAENEDTGEKVRLKYVKQKKTRHRHYKVGKSQHTRNVGVLVSNRTIRKGITTKTQLMKQTPIHEIRAFLVKRGLIKVGTPAPNEVLRKMYETAQLMCGELHNHNTDILLHNFMTDGGEVI